VVRDVGRVLDLGYNFCDQIAKLIPMQPGKQITLAMAREMEPLLAEREQNEEEVRELRRGLLLRMREFLEEGKVLHAPSPEEVLRQGIRGERRTS